MAQLLRKFGCHKLVNLSKKTLSTNYDLVQSYRSLIDESFFSKRSSFVSRCQLHTSALLSKSNPTERIDPLAEPIKFSTSGARTWRASENLYLKDKPPIYQPFVVVISLGVFLLYFCVLREENDVDDELNSSLYMRIPGLEEKNIKSMITYNKKNGLSTKELEDRLKEIRGMGAAARRVQD